MLLPKKGVSLSCLILILSSYLIKFISIISINNSELKNSYFYIGFMTK